MGIDDFRLVRFAFLLVQLVFTRKRDDAAVLDLAAPLCLILYAVDIDSAGSVGEVEAAVLGAEPGDRTAMRSATVIS